MSLVKPKMTKKSGFFKDFLGHHRQGERRAQENPSWDPEVATRAAFGKSEKDEF